MKKKPNKLKSRRYQHNSPQFNNIPQHFLTIRYHSAECENNIKTVLAIIIEYNDVSTRILDLDSENCLEQWKELLKQWDKKTDIRIWCDQRGIQWKRFTRSFSTKKIINIQGVIYCPEPYEIVKRIVNRKRKNGKIFLPKRKEMVKTEVKRW